ncbi:Receptor-interacting serine/threonine-protein kinase 3 [Tulasnella sp. UAMH 9824]|nr:Receptor-interacting serine/threonine-protein kinase 3 [Tulasnella sp. UAMH 9824]
MSNGDVLEYIERFKPDIQQRIAFTKCITAGRACLHNFDPAICHADLKPANVLLDLHMNAVLCDFGLASFVGDSPTASGLVTTTALKGGTPRYMSPELHSDDDCTHNLEGDVWAWGCTVFHVLTGTIPYAKALSQRQLCMAIVQEQPPGDITMLLSNNFEGADPKSALALRFLRSVIPKLNVAGENEGGRVGGSSGGATFAEASEIPSGDVDQDEVAREGNQDLLENYNLQAKEATEENVWVDHEKTETKGGTDSDERASNDLHAHGDTRNTLTNAHAQDNKPVEETLNAGQDGIGLEAVSSDNEPTTGHGVTGDKVADIVADQPSTKVSTPALGPIILGVACILALLSAVAYQSLQISYSSPPPGPAASHPDHAPDKISPQPLSAIIWPAICIISIFVNICFAYFVLRKADSPPSRDREKPATSTLERS